ncbi:MAG TPA: hypothetical protein VL983_00195 [Terriglobales bacterium]|nr:hypothetical protein [Terriglobales bacterium]
MRINHKATLVAILAIAMFALAPVSVTAQVLTGEDLKKIVPASFFYAGQTAPVQERNSVAVKNSAGKLTLAGLVDTAGYSTAIAEKYQGFLITESKLTFDNSTLDIGAYGFGFKDGKLFVTNLAGGDIFSVASQRDEQVKHPVPLKFEKAEGGYRLYSGRNYVTFKTE